MLMSLRRPRHGSTDDGGSSASAEHAATRPSPQTHASPLTSVAVVRVGAAASRIAEDQEVHVPPEQRPEQQSLAAVHRAPKTRQHRPTWQV